MQGHSETKWPHAAQLTLCKCLDVGLVKFIFCICSHQNSNALQNCKKRSWAQWHFNSRTTHIRLNLTHMQSLLSRQFHVKRVTPWQRFTGRSMTLALFTVSSRSVWRASASATESGNKIHPCSALAHHTGPNTGGTLWRSGNPRKS